MKTDPTITAITRLQAKAAELNHRARAIAQLLLVGDVSGLPFGVEMLRESVSAVDFWFAQLEKAVAK